MFFLWLYKEKKQYTKLIHLIFFSSFYLTFDLCLVYFLKYLILYALHLIHILTFYSTRSEIFYEMQSWPNTPLGKQLTVNFAPVIACLLTLIDHFQDIEIKIHRPLILSGDYFNRYPLYCNNPSSELTERQMFFEWLG